ncbi:unnamed protein product [Victoria cruziana]
MIHTNRNWQLIAIQFWRGILAQWTSTINSQLIAHKFALRAAFGVMWRKARRVVDPSLCCFIRESPPKLSVRKG